ncbi:MAG TPA: nuclear transport factor 2 family protein [Acidobacteriaceae bacterium]|nr:nuclear transport factor 2 family protein [Acidobacteriaceae bacterium]
MQRLGLVLIVVLMGTVPSRSQAAPEAVIQQLLHRQTEDWNRGDVNAFMTGYDDSPETTFVSEKVEYGYAKILARYRRVYASRAAMGKLTFSNLAIRILDSNYAAATGNFHLDRSAAGGGNADGIFSLILKNEPSGWKIILDHSTRTH